MNRYSNENFNRDPVRNLFLVRRYVMKEVK